LICKLAVSPGLRLSWLCRGEILRPLPGAVPAIGDGVVAANAAAEVSRIEKERTKTEIRLNILICVFAYIPFN
jgi:hypothetical protein